MGKLVTVQRTSFPWQADMICLTLQAEDIPTFVADANVVSMNWLYSNAIGGVKVQVPEEYVERAKDVLASESPQPMLASTDDDEFACPKCHSKNTSIIRKGLRWSFLSWLVLNFPVVYPLKRYYCLDCGNTWKKKKS